MRAGPLALAALASTLVLAGACTAGDRSDFGSPAGAPAPSSSPTTTVPPTTPAPSTSPAPSTTAVATTDPAGSVTLRVTGLVLPDVRAGGSGLRVLVRAAAPRLTVRRRGGGGAVSVCPVAGPAGPASDRECVDVVAQATVELGAAGGVELRAAAAGATVDEVSLTYLPAGRATTLVTPARPAGACAARPCEATYSLLPGGAGAFVLDARGSGGRPRLVLTAGTPTGSPVSNRTLATVEGGGSLSIRATLEAGSEARLLHHEEGTEAVAPLTAEILWP